MTWQTWQDPIQITLDALELGINGNGTSAVPIGISRPKENVDHFIRIMLFGGQDKVQQGFVEASIIEVESWATSPQRAYNGLLSARRAIHDAAYQQGPVRRVDEASKPSELPPSEEGWYRYRMAFSIDLSTRGSNQ